MKLYLLRHGTASDIAPSDATRALTSAGEKESRIAGAALKRLGAAPAAIFASPFVRARQTAEIAARALSFDGEIEVMAELENGASTTALLKALKSHDRSGEILLVGHMPSLAGHVAALIGAALKDLDGLALGKGGVACVQLEELRAGAGRLRWLMRQPQLEHLLDEPPNKTKK